MVKDMNELIETRKLKVAELEGLLKSVKDEQRKMFTDEDEKFNAVNKAIEELDKQIEEKRSINTKNNNKIIIPNNKMEKNFSLVKSIRDYVEGRSMSEDTLEVMTAGKKEMTDAGVSYRGQIQLPYEYRTIINATTATKVNIQFKKINWI